MKTDGTDSIYNGANDNASGVAVLIELAKYYSVLKANRFTLIFIAFSGEEMGLLGSGYQSRLINYDYLKAVINMDMVGRPIRKKFSKCMVLAEESKNIITVLNRQLPKKKFFIADKFPGQELWMRSDNASFQRCKTAFSFMCSSPDNKYYHSPGDELNTINFPFLLLAAGNIARGCLAFIK